MRTELHDRVGRELECFPDNTTQERILRSAFYDGRMGDLGKNSEHPGATALESAERAVAAVRAQIPNFPVEFDRDCLARLDARGAA